MTKRVLDLLPSLPAAVVASMVKGLDADDLDHMLTYPAGLVAQVR